jgi:hypothetical protein
LPAPGPWPAGEAPSLSSSGNSGNGGRKPGSRNRLGEGFIKAVASDFAEHGIRVIETVRVERPEIWLKIVSDFLRKEAQDKIQGVGSCESIGEVVSALLAELGIDEALSMCDVLL